MPCFKTARLVFDLLPAPAPKSLRRPISLHWLHLFPKTTIALPNRRALSITAHHDARRNDLFKYTSGEWIFNNALRHAERRHVFNVDELCQLAAQSVNRSPDDIVDLIKLAEGGFNRIFLITMHGGFQMVARIPYPVTDSKYFAVASEVATMSLLRSSGLPVPEIYGYSPTPDNAAETEYILMEFVQGTKLSEVWRSLEEEDIISVLCQLVQLESKMMSIDFPAGGSLYYTRDLEKAGRGPGITLEDNSFSVGPDTRLPLWFGRRSRLDVDRGPYETAEAALTKPAYKELAYLDRFGQPMLPFQRMRREAYKYKEQSPSDHIENLGRYLLIAPSLVPRNPVLTQFRIRHPDLQHNNIIVSKSPDTGWQVIGVLDWQHTSILPIFLLAGVPERLQNYDDPFSRSMTPPSLPKDLDKLSETEQRRVKETYHSRLVHHHYVKSTEECNKLHYAALMNPLNVLRRRLFYHASRMWEGETFELKSALIDATENWETLTRGGIPCPVIFSAEDVRETKKLEEVQRQADETLEGCRNMIGFGEDGWVNIEHYEDAMASSKKLKEDALAAAETPEERAEIEAHWILDDMDEEIYT